MFLQALSTSQTLFLQISAWLIRPKAFLQPYVRIEVNVSGCFHSSSSHWYQALRYIQNCFYIEVYQNLRLVWGCFLLSIVKEKDMGLIYLLSAIYS